MTPFPFLPDHNDLIRQPLRQGAPAMRAARHQPLPGHLPRHAPRRGCDPPRRPEALIADAVETVAVLGRTMDDPQPSARPPSSTCSDRGGQDPGVHQAGRGLDDEGFRPLSSEFLDGGDLVGVGPGRIFTHQDRRDHHRGRDAQAIVHQVRPPAPGEVAAASRTSSCAIDSATWT
jgi:hypothetical protein